jgi:hypothetical protein
MAVRNIKRYIPPDKQKNREKHKAKRKFIASIIAAISILIILIAAIVYAFPKVYQYELDNQLTTNQKTKPNNTSLILGKDITKPEFYLMRVDNDLVTTYEYAPGSNFSKSFDFTVANSLYPINTQMEKDVDGGFYYISTIEQKDSVVYTKYGQQKTIFNTTERVRALKLDQTKDNLYVLVDSLLAEGQLRTYRIYKYSITADKIVEKGNVFLAEDRYQLQELGSNFIKLASLTTINCLQVQVKLSVGNQLGQPVSCNNSNDTGIFSLVKEYIYDNSALPESYPKSETHFRTNIYLKKDYDEYQKKLAAYKAKPIGIEPFIPDVLYTSDIDFELGILQESNKRLILSAVDSMNQELEVLDMTFNNGKLQIKPNHNERTTNDSNTKVKDVESLESSIDVKSFGEIYQTQPAQLLKLKRQTREDKEQLWAYRDVSQELSKVEIPVCTARATVCDFVLIDN